MAAVAVNFKSKSGAGRRRWRANERRVADKTAKIEKKSQNWVTILFFND